MICNWRLYRFFKLSSQIFELMLKMSHLENKNKELYFSVFFGTNEWFLGKNVNCFAFEVSSLLFQAI